MITPLSAGCTNAPASSNTTQICVNIGWDVYYYIDNSDANNPRLVRYVVDRNAASSNKKEVIANYVEDFQVVFGEDTDGDGIIAAGEWGNSATDPSKVRMVRVSVMLVSPKAGQKTVTLPALENSAIVQPTVSTSPYYPNGAYHHRRVLSRTIRLRNVGG